jgi:putative transposase
VKLPNTYTQLYTQIIFAVKGRENLVRNTFKDELYKYIAGIIRNDKQKLLAINGMPDHVHIFIGMNPDISVSVLTNHIKSNSSKFINTHTWLKGKFNWQEGFGAFSYSRSQIDRVVKYIINQEIHHKKKTFKEEYIEILKKFCIEYNEKYLFDWIDISNFENAE